MRSSDGIQIDLAVTMPSVRGHSLVFRGFGSEIPLPLTHYQDYFSGEGLSQL